MLKKLSLLALFVIALPAFGTATGSMDSEPVTGAIDASVAEPADSQEAEAATELAVPGVAQQEQLAGGGGRCLHSAPDCGSSTGGCGGKEFWSSCNGGAGVCAEACDSQQYGGTICECWSFSFSGLAGSQPHIAQFLEANEQPRCQRSSQIADAD